MRARGRGRGRLADRVGDRRGRTRDRRRGCPAFGRCLVRRLCGRRDGVALARQRSAEEPDLVADDVAARGSGHAQCRDPELGRPQPDDRAARGNPAAACGGRPRQPSPPPRSPPCPRTAAAAPARGQRRRHGARLRGRPSEAAAAGRRPRGPRARALARCARTPGSWSGGGARALIGRHQPHERRRRRGRRPGLCSARRPRSRRPVRAAGRGRAAPPSGTSRGCPARRGSSRRRSCDG